jgi:hypothetical protein
MQALGVSYWDVEDNSPPGGGDERPTDGDWKSPFTDPSNLFGQIGWGSTWFSDRYLWEWQQVYEFSFESDACSGAPDDWFVQTSLDTPASPSKRQNEICGIDANQGSLTVLKDAIPDDPWSKYEFFVAGPTPAAFTLQDPGSNECPADPLCGNPDDAGAWTHPDRITTTNMIASDSFGGATYRVQERNPAAGYTVGWECKNAAVPLASTCDPASSIFDFAACAAVAPVCAPARSDWADGYISCQESDPDFAICAPGDVGAQTDAFELCSGGHVLCRFINHAGQESDEVCLESENAIGDLQVLGGVESETVSFTTAAAPVSAADAPDSIFLASFMPIADESRWPGTVDHFVQPLPVVADAEGDLLPDRSRLCAGPEDTACLAWDAAVEILTQAPDASAVLADRQIGLAATERRVTYTQGASGATVPRPLRAFDYDDADAPADEYDLWLGMDIAFVSGDTESETAARDAARHVIRETLQERTVSVTDPSTGEPRTVPYVVGDVFHGDPV